MPTPLTRDQQLENAAFLRALAAHGNVRLAAETMGCGANRFRERRRKHPAFAAQWDAAVVLADAALAIGATAPGTDPGGARITLSSSGWRQLRRPRRGQIDHAGRQRFLAALSASANVSLSAAAAGDSSNALYALRRRDSGFAREWRLALATGYDRLEMTLLAGWSEEGFADDDWRRNDQPAIPPMTVDQAIHLLTLHRREARCGGLPTAMRRRGESQAAMAMRLGLMAEHVHERARERYRIAEAERLARGEPTQQRWVPGERPDLSQVTGWSRAKEGAPGAEGRAPFGGWRRDDRKGKRG